MKQRNAKVARFYEPKLPIDIGRLIPHVGRYTGHHPLDDLKLGESYLALLSEYPYHDLPRVNCGQRLNIQSAAQRRGIQVTIRLRREEGGFRVWRVA